DSTATAKPADDNSAADAAVKSPAAKPLPKETGPTDADPEQRELGKYELDWVRDDPLKLEFYPEDYDAYFRLTRWVVNQPIDLLASRANQKDPPWGELVKHPQIYRQVGKIYRFEMNVQRNIADEPIEVSEKDETSQKVQLYEMIGATDLSMGHLIQLKV